MMLRNAVVKLGAVIAEVLLSLVWLAAIALSPWRIGRMLQTVSLPRMREHRLRTSFTVLGIGLGVSILVAVVLVSRSIERGVTSTIDDLAGKADLQVRAASSGFDEGVLDKIRDLPGVFKLTPSMQQVVTVRAQGGRRERLLLLGVDLLGTDDRYLRSYSSAELETLRTDPLPFLNSSQNLILGREFAERIGARLHDKIAITTGTGVREFEVWGFVEGNGVGRAFGGAMGLMYYPAMQVAFGRGRNIDHIDIAVEPGRDPETVAKALRAVLGEAFGIERPAFRGDRVGQMLTTLRSALTMASLLALLAGAFLVVNTMTISVVQRKRELGTLRALGATRRELISLLTLEGVLLGSIGSALGTVFAIFLSRSMLATFSDAVSQIYLEQSASDVDVDLRVLIAGLLLGVVSSGVAAFLATRRAGRIKPAEALSSSALPSLVSETRTRPLDLAGAGLLLLAALLLRIPPFGHLPVGPFASAIVLTLGARAFMPGLVRLMHGALARFQRRLLGVEALLASNNLPRDLPRTAGTASGLMAGAALTICAGTFITSFITSLNTWSAQLVPGDLFVTSGAVVSGLSGRNTPMAEAVGAELAAIPGVELVRPTATSSIDFRGTPVKLDSTDVAIFARHSRLTGIEGSEQDAIEGMLRGGITVSENFARLNDVHRGDLIPLSTKDGTSSFEVAAVIVDYTSDLGTIRMDRATYIKYWGDPRVDTYELFLRPDTSPESVRRLINDQLGERYDLFVLTNREFRGEFVKAVNSIFSLIRVLEIVTLIVAAMGMVTSVLANVLDRVREIGVLRALGMLRAQVRKMVVVEATLIGGIGTVGGTLTGLALAYILLRHVATVQMGWYLPYQLPVAALVTVVAVNLPISALAGFYPALHAARLVVSDALDYE